MAYYIDEVVGKNIKTLRLEMKLSQEQLAQRAETSKQTISNIEKGNGANSKTITRLAEIMGVNVTRLYQETDKDSGNKRRSYSTDNLRYGAELERAISTIRDIHGGDFLMCESVISKCFNENLHDIADSFLTLSEKDVAKLEQKINGLLDKAFTQLREAFFYANINNDDVDEIIE